MRDTCHSIGKRPSENSAGQERDRMTFHSRKRLMMEDKLEGTQDVGGTNQRLLVHSGDG